MSKKESDIALNICSGKICMPETVYAFLVRQIAAGYFARDCKETSSNRGVCVDEIKIIYGDAEPTNEAWCAQAAFTLHRLACRHLQKAETLPRTKGALDMLLKSKKVLRVDTFPEPGAVGYRKTNIKGVTGHIFTVLAVEDSEKIWTADGNMNNRFGLRYYDAAQWQKKSNGFEFIHVEDNYRLYRKFLHRLEFY